MAKKILLADDSITIQKVVELTFSDGDYEVVAVNNGAKAIQKLAEMRPDIILSDIIMPEKNGYEVCEYVKSHPDLRNIPVVLLTGTFEPFDPDRADKAGCDAVVTKPFESQSLIHKVEELISTAQTSAPSAAAPTAPPPSPWADEDEPATSAFTPAPPEPVFGGGVSGFQTNDNDIFGSAPASAPPTTEMPFETAPADAFSGETRAFPRMSFEEMQQMAGMSSTPQPAAPAPPPPPPAAAPSSPWDEQPSEPAFGGETRAFPRMSFEELSAAANPPAPAASAPEPSPWDEQPAFGGGGETRAFPRMSFEELSAAANPPAAAPESSPWDDNPAEPPAASVEASPWDEQPSEAAFGETRAFPRMSFDELQQMHSAPGPVPAPEPEPEPEPTVEASPWDEQPAEPAFGGETRAFPRMSFDELQQQMQSASAPAPAPEPEPEPEPAAAVSPWDEAPAAAEEEMTPVEAAPIEEEEPESPFAPPQEEEELPAAAAALEAFPTAVNSQITDEVETPAEAAPAPAGDLTDEQIDRIARRVVQMMSEQVVRNIAWEVIPDVAEMVVKDRIRQLEAEA